MLSTVQGLAGQFMEAGRALIAQLAAGIKSGAGAAIDAISSVAAQVRGALPFSPAKWGPLSDIDQSGPGLINTLARGIQQDSPLLSAAATTMQAVRDLLNPNLDPAITATAGATGGGTASPQLAPAIAAANTTNNSSSSSSQQSSNITVYYSAQITASGSGDLGEQLRSHAEELARMLEERQQRSQYTRYGAAL